MPLKTTTDELPMLNLTPMIDVVFNLLLFFMVSTQFIEDEAGGERSIETVSVPQVAAPGTVAAVRTQWVVTIHRDGKLTANEQTLSLEQLTAQLTQARKASPKVTVMVRGDAEASFQSVAGVLQAVRQAGVSELGISVRLAAAADAQKR